MDAASLQCGAEGAAPSLQHWAAVVGVLCCVRVSNIKMGLELSLEDHSIDQMYECLSAIGRISSPSPRCTCWSCPVLPGRRCSPQRIACLQGRRCSLSVTDPRWVRCVDLSFRPVSSQLRLSPVSPEPRTCQSPPLQRAIVPGDRCLGGAGDSGGRDPGRDEYEGDERPNIWEICPIPVQS